MQKIKIRQRAPDSFEVTVNDETTSTHIVTVTDAQLQLLTNGKMSKKELLAFSFAFLLEREPNTSILSRFEITLINQYFPEYKAAVKAAVKKV